MAPSVLSSQNIHCPYCGETVCLQVDTSAGSQEYVEDCSVCCQPIEVSVQLQPNGEYELTAKRDDAV